METASERRDQRRLEVLERRQRTVGILVEMEKMMSQGTDGTRDLPLETHVHALPEKLQPFVREAVTEYRRRVSEAKIADTYLRKVATGRFGEANAETMARAVFEMQTGGAALGAPSIVQKEGYFILTVDNASDYQRVRDPKETRKYPDTPQGTFHFYLEFLAEDVPDELKNASFIVENQSFDPDLTIRHERQHFINHMILKKFQIAEPKRRAALTRERDSSFWHSFREIFTSAKDWRKKQDESSNKERLIDAEAGVKDEVIAYFRDHGDSVDRLFDILAKHPRYEHLWQKLNSEERSGLERHLSQAIQGLKLFDDVRDDDIRSALTWHLIDVPLPKIRKTAEAMKEFFDARMAAIRQPDIYAPEAVRGTVLPSEYRQTQNTLQDAKARCDDTVMEYTRAVYLEGAGLLSLWEERMQKFSHARSVMEMSSGELGRVRDRIPYVSVSIVDAFSLKLAGEVADLASSFPKTNMEDLSKMKRPKNPMVDAFLRTLEAGGLRRPLLTSWWQGKREIRVEFTGYADAGASLYRFTVNIPRVSMPDQRKAA